VFVAAQTRHSDKAKASDAVGQVSNLEPEVTEMSCCTAFFRPVPFDFPSTDAQERSRWYQAQHRWKCDHIDDGCKDTGWRRRALTVC